MFIKKQLSAKDNLHHAYLIEGEYEAVLPELVSYLEEKGIIKKGSPDLHRIFEETLKIDSARHIKESQIEKSSQSGGKKIFIIGANFFTREAANSLLKVFEEPAEGVHFFLITPNPHLLPATLLSRVHLIAAENKKEINPAILAEANKFLSAGHAARIKQIEEFIKKFEDLEADENNMKSRAQAWINAMETLLHRSEQDIRNKLYEFGELSKARDYITDRGSSAKMLLEHLALVLPIIK
jgi:DNA polymerase III delta prime subunit